ncbi:MAG: S8 family serine peptidase, partial [Bacteroidota bacterium]
MKNRLILFLSIITSISLQAQITYTVNTADDINDGTCNAIHCSLREAINEANTDGVSSNIHFNISGTAPFVIAPSSQLPIINEANTSIDATTQADWILGDIVIDGSSTSSAHGLVLSANNITIKGLEIRDFDLNGILNSFGSATLEIANNLIYDNTIDGMNLQSITSTTIKSNIIYANGEHGIRLSNCSNSRFEDNYIGTDLTFSIGLGNIFKGIFGAASNTVFDGNISVGNMDGIELISGGNNKFIHNQFGTEQTGGNTLRGIVISNPNQDSIIENTLAYNDAGITVAGTITSVLVSGNSIFCNTSDGITANVNLETAPIISTVSQTSITGTSTANYKIEIFLSDTTSCSTAPCQGKILLGTTTADGSGNWILNAPYFASIPPLAQVTATATSAAAPITSGFAACQTLTNDDCTTAFDLVVNSAACVGTTTTASNAGATSSAPLPTGACVSTFGGGDIWFKAVLPFSGNMLIRQRVGTNIQPVVEAYLGSCSGTAIDCKALENDPNVLIIDLEQADAGSDIFFRVWDDGNDEIGDVVLSAHFLPNDPAAWEICGDPAEEEEDNSSEGASRRVANEFVVQYDQDTTGLAANDMELEENADLVQSCDCSIRTLQLWQTTTPDTVEIFIDTAITLQNVLQTSYNYIIGEQPCTGLGQRQRFPQFIYQHQPPMQDADSVKVAIVDTGVDTDHVLLENAFWTNTRVGEGCLPDDAIGYNFYDQTATPEDVDGHGTWVNGAVVRDFPNDIKLDLMNMKFKEVDDGSLFDAVCGIYHAIEEQADIIVLSWNFKSNEFPQIFFEALDEARKRGILIFTAAGNTPENNNNNNKYPSNFDLDNILTVTAYEVDLDGSDIRLGHYASFGKNNVDIAALGFLETTDLNDAGSLARTTSVAGTTLAAPLVARTAAIIKGTFPELTWTMIKDCILNTVDRQLDLRDKIGSEGILNHDQAMLCARTKAAEITAACSSSNLMLSFQVSPDNCNTGTGSIDLALSNAVSPSFLWSTDAITEDIDGLYADKYTVTVTDGSGCVKVETVAIPTDCPNLRTQLADLKQSYSIPKNQSPSNMRIHQNPSLAQSKEQLMISPNPFQDVLSIRLHGEVADNTTIRLFDLNGKPYFTRYLTRHPKDNILTLDTAHLPSGIYFV